MTGHDQIEDYITEVEASAILNRSPRQVRRYGRTGKVAVREGPGGRMYRRADVELLAADLREKDAWTGPVKADLVPVSDLLEHLERKDDEIRELNERLQRAMLEIGRLQKEVEMQQRQLPAPDTSEQDRPRPRGWRRWLRRILE